ncbi:hypothetical protein P5673_016892 [Acropora cervicornis]|uniref:Uncharacterized protein n=1 Tax=Acropora cervicornis TaxID=6130 RepID=A0AAD9QFU8_ACRCE|nr:hypothetical protein P5673_016892 [Acropora cervicornis]
MAGKQTNQNPFAALFPSLEKAEDYRKQHEFSATLVQTDHKHGDTVMEAEAVKLSMKKIHDRDRVGKKQYGGLPKRCVYLRNTAIDGEVSLLQWISIDEVN